ncbi:hypothetical protein GE09DRAFT_182997 [Coniochaeta sp. 2T2.1]|nr:hypothetical protein GE09DRAFT_182997 [Coniochaeta sp. 2T2.1]
MCFTCLKGGLLLWLLSCVQPAETRRSFLLNAFAASHWPCPAAMAALALPKGACPPQKVWLCFLVLLGAHYRCHRWSDAAE